MSLVERAKGILLAPKKEWTVIEAETATVGGLYTGYIIPLALIPAVAEFVGRSMIGYSLLGATFRLPMSMGIEIAVIRFVSALVGVYILALIIDALAPNFGATKNSMQALKVATYSSTAAWVAGIFYIIPGLAVLGLLGLYSLYLLFLGLPALMKAPEDKALGYTIVVLVCGVVLAIIVNVVVDRFIGRAMLGGM